HEISKLAGGPDYRIEFVRGDYYELGGGITKWNIRTLIYPAMPPLSPSKGIHFGPRTNGRLYLGPSASSPAKAASKQLFLDAGRRFLPRLSEDDLQWSYSGIRPRNVNSKGKADFLIRLDRRKPMLVNLIGIDSPGLSASMAIAQAVYKILTPS